MKHQAPMILVVEPDRPLARQIQLYLDSHGYRVKVVFSTASAMAVLEASRPDALILEVDAPHHNGIELLYELRSYDDLNDIPVIVYSLRHPRHFRQGLLQFGVVAHLYKPDSRLAQLVAALQECVLPGRVGNGA